MKFKELRERTSTINSWINSWFDIGHHGHIEYVDLWWIHAGEIYVHPDDGETTHDDLFWEEGHNPTFFGRVDHKKKLISMQPNTRGFIHEKKIKHAIRIVRKTFNVDWPVWVFGDNKSMDLYEKFQQGKSVKYHINPTARDMHSFLMNSRYKGIRLWTFEGDLYIWDAAYTTHSSFFHEEFPDSYKNSGVYKHVSDTKTGHFYISDKYSSHFGNDILKTHKTTMDEFLNIIGEEYTIEWIKGHAPRIDLRLHAK